MFTIYRYNNSLVAGRTIIAGLTSFGLYAKAKLLDERVLRIRSTTDTGTVYERDLPLDDEDVLSSLALGGGFFSYCAGVAYIFATEFNLGTNKKGIEIDNYKTTLPMGKGLSSSAAVCVLVARAFNRLFNLNLSTRGEMQVAFNGERLTPSQCGRMDQAVAFGSVPIVMEYSGDLLKVQPAKLAATMFLVLIDLKATKSTVRILEALQGAYPHPQTAQEKAVVKLFGEINENVTRRAQELLEKGDAAGLGALMIESQRYFDEFAGPLCPDQLGEEGSPVLHRVLRYEPIQQYIFGGKGVGSQGDGTAQLLCRSAEAQETVCRILERDLGVGCLKVDLQCSTGGGSNDMETANGSIGNGDMVGI